MSNSQSATQHAIDTAMEKLSDIITPAQQEHVKQAVRDAVARYKAKRALNKPVYGYLLPALTLYVAYKVYKYAVPAPTISSSGKSVVISGCDTGFGHGVAVALDKMGYIVYAGVFSESSKGAVELKQKLSNRSHVIKLDITKQSDIDGLVNKVKSNSHTLHALINNAGIGGGGLVDWVTMDHIRSFMEVNFFGHVMMTKAFLPLLTAKADSRIVNLCSSAGYICGPGMVAYNCSKYAMEAFSDTLRREMAMWQVKVCIIEPGFMKTPIVEGHEGRLLELWKGLDQTYKERYGEGFGEKLVANNMKSTSGLIERAEDPSIVVKDIVHGVESTAPRIRYRSGWQSSKLLFPLSMMPAWIADWVMEKQVSGAPQPAGLLKQFNQLQPSS